MTCIERIRKYLDTYEAYSKRVPEKILCSATFYEEYEKELIEHSVYHNARLINPETGEIFVIQPQKVCRMLYKGIVLLPVPSLTDDTIVIC